MVPTELELPLKRAKAALKSEKAFVNGFWYKNEPLWAAYRGIGVYIRKAIFMSAFSAAGCVAHETGQTHGPAEQYATHVIEVSDVRDRSAIAEGLLAYVGQLAEVPEPVLNELAAVPQVADVPLTAEAAG